MQEVVKKDNESFENLLRRFNRRVQQSGKMPHLRKKMHFEKEPNKRERRVDAIRKAKIKKIRHLKREGRL